MKDLLQQLNKVDLSITKELTVNGVLYIIASVTQSNSVAYVTLLSPNGMKLTVVV